IGVPPEQKCDDHELTGGADRRSCMMLDRLRQDVHFASVSLRRSPAFCATALAVLAIGIGMSAAMAAVFRTVLIERLPVTDQDRIAVLWTYRVPGTENAV